MAEVPEMQQEAGAAAPQGGLSEEEKQKLLEMSQISLWLDRYEDIFSDFDPRPYSQRALSDDFLLEANKASRDKASGSIELKLLIPTDKRNTSQEPVIKKRLREHFKKHYDMLKGEAGGMLRQGLLFVVFGLVLMFLATYILFAYSEGGLLFSFLVVILEPGGWFLFWEGLDLLIFKPKTLKQNLKFYEKMSKCEVQFLPY